MRVGVSPSSDTTNTLEVTKASAENAKSGKAKGGNNKNDQDTEAKPRPSKNTSIQWARLRNIKSAQQNKTRNANIP